MVSAAAFVVGGKKSQYALVTELRCAWTMKEKRIFFFLIHKSPTNP